MKRQNISSGSPFEKSIGFSRAVRIGNVLSVSGTAPIADDGSAAFPGDLYNQTKRCLAIIEKAIQEGGGTLGDVIRTRMFLTDISRWEEAAKAHGEVFRDIRPAATMVEVKGLINPSWLIEMEADCIIE
jgi:enamine deaminase RidA (YjgF/YER057c/UK114 family)